MNPCDLTVGAGVKAVVCVADNIEIDPTKWSIPFAIVPLPDNVVYSTLERATVMAVLKGWANVGLTPLLIMCRAGLSRSACFAASWIAEVEDIPLDEAVEKVRHARAACFPHATMVEQFR